MKRGIAFTSTLGAISLALMALAPTASAGTGATSTPDAQATLNFPDVTLDGSGLCFETEISVDVVAPADVFWAMDVQFRKPGTVPLSSTGRFSGEGSRRETDMLQICPTDGTGEMLVEGEFTTYGNVEVSAPIATSFVLSKTPATVRMNPVKYSKGRTRVTGKVTTESAQYGTVTTYGDVVAQYQLPRTKRWRTLGESYTNNSGFTIEIGKRFPRGTKYRVLFEGNDFALTASSSD